jgi:hypothetical protein
MDSHEVDTRWKEVAMARRVVRIGKVERELSLAALQTRDLRLDINSPTTFRYCRGKMTALSTV